LCGIEAVLQGVVSMVLRRIFKGTVIGLIVLGVLWLGTCALMPSGIPAELRAKIQASLKNAKVVEIIPCEQPGLNDHETGMRVPLHVFEDKAVVLDSARQQELRSILARRRFFQGGAHLRCFDPHYLIRSTLENGERTEMQLCFDCSNFSVNESIFVIPPAWEWSLKPFIRDLGFTEHLD
jgi:hypothetical protein